MIWYMEKGKLKIAQLLFKKIKIIIKWCCQNGYHTQGSLSKTDFMVMVP
jgi:hypothetical protein